MKRPASRSRRALSILAFTVAACGTDPTAPSPLKTDVASNKMDFAAPLFGQDDDDEGREVVGVLQREEALDERITVTATITNKGGTIRIEDAGLVLQIPANALNGAASMKFTVTALAGRSIAYEFGPHGTTFSAPLTVVQNMKETNWKTVRDLYSLEGAYFTDPSKLSPDQTLALVNEFRPTWVEVGKNKLSFTVDHFSGYLVSSGRSR